MDRSRIEGIVERLRRGSSLALVADRNPAARARDLRLIERELSALGRTTLWIDLDGAESGAELGGRIVEGCMSELDPDDLGDLLERLPSRGRLDLEALAELLMLPESVATTQGRRVVAILDGFETVERVIGFAGLAAVRDALLLRDRTTYLFVGSPRVEALFTRPQSPLSGLAEVVGARETSTRERGRPATVSDSDASAPAAEADPLAAALLGWAEAPAPPKSELVIVREMPSPAQAAWDRFMAREQRERDRWDWDDDDDRPWRRRRRGRR